MKVFCDIVGDLRIQVPLCHGALLKDKELYVEHEWVLGSIKYLARQWDLKSKKLFGRGLFIDQKFTLNKICFYNLSQEGRPNRKNICESNLRLKNHWFKRLELHFLIRIFFK